MKKLFFLIGILMLFSACQMSRKQGGSMVGNGTIKFHNDLYDYSFLYDSRLHLIEESKEKVIIENSRSALAMRQKISKISFIINAVQGMNAEKLFTYATQKNPQANWSSILVSGVPGWFFRNENQESLNAEYLFLLGESAILHVTLEANAEADGIKLLTPIIDTLGFDTSSPVVHEAYFDPATVKAGETAKFKFRATDNMSGIRGTDPYGNVHEVIERKCRQLSGQVNFVESCGNFRHLQDDWYEFDVPTHPRMKPDDYILYPVVIWDGAGNSLTLLSSRETGLIETFDKQKSLPLALLKVLNDEPDTKAPNLSDVRFEPASLRAGESGKIIFAASDDDPAFDVKICEAALLENTSDYLRTDSSPNQAPQQVDFGVSICNKTRKRDDGMMEVEFNTEQHLAPGKYSLHLKISDAVGNSSDVIKVSLNITSDREIDTAGPVLLDAQVSKAEYRTGETGTVLLKIVDNLSGVSKDSFRNFRSCDFGFINALIDKDNWSAGYRLQLCDSQFRHIEGDWYAIDFTLGTNLPTGEYWLPSFSFSDTIGNRTNMTTYKGKYSHVLSGQETTIPALRFRVVR